MRATITTCIAAAALAATPAWAQDYGPDAFGYFGNDIPNNFVDISGSGTDITGLLTNLDDGGVVVPLGFSFQLYGTSMTSIGFSTNGYMAAPGQPLTDFTNNCPIATASTPNLGIYPYWSDLRLNEHGSMHHETVGTVFTAQWTDVGSFDDSGTSVTMQVRLDGSDDSIEYHYGTLDGGPLGTFDATGGDGSIGIEDDTGAIALSVACNTPGAISSGGDGIRIELGATAMPIDYGFNPIAPNFMDISGTGTDVTGLITNLDDGGVVVPIGFSFFFYGATITSIGFSTNGYLTDGGPLTDFTNDCPIPNPLTPNRGIYPYWSDLRLNEHGSMLHETMGAPGSQVFIAQWNDVGSFDDSSAHVTMQVKLFEDCHEIEFHYALLDSGLSGAFDATGGEGTVGIEGDGTIATLIACNTPGTISVGTAFHLFPLGSQTLRFAAIPNPGTLIPDPAGGPVIGTIWAPTVVGALPMPALDFLALSTLPPIDVPVAFGSLLVQPIAPLIQFNLSPGTPFAIQVPNDCSLVPCVMISTQGGSASFGPLNVRLTHAIDLGFGSS